jgi:hypothetical protein
MQTLFETKVTKKAKITFEELESQKSSILPNREELQVMDYSMLNTPYYAAPASYNSMGNNSFGSPYGNSYTSYDPNAFSQQSFTGFQPQTQQFQTQPMQFQPMQFQPQVVPPTPTYDFTHVTGYQPYGNAPVAYHAQTTYAYDPNCNYNYNQGDWSHNSTSSWNGNWNNENWNQINHGPGNSDWGHSHNVSTSVQQWNPSDWNNPQYKGYINPNQGEIYIYPYGNYKA